jgi:hypothetical protein
VLLLSSVYDADGADVLQKRWSLSIKLHYITSSLPKRQYSCHRQEKKKNLITISLALALT